MTGERIGVFDNAHLVEAQLNWFTMRHIVGVFPQSHPEHLLSNRT